MQVPINQLTPKEFNTYLNSLTTEQKEELFANPEILLSFTDSTFLMAFQRQSAQTKLKLLKNGQIVKRILTGTSNAKIRSAFDYLNKEEQNIVLTHTNLLITIEESILENILKKIPSDIKEIFIKNLQNQIQNIEIPKNNPKLTVIQKIIQGNATIEELMKNWNISSREYAQQFLTFCKQDKRNPFILLQIQTNNEFIVYLKTSCYLTEKEIQDYEIPLSILNKINLKSFIKLVTLYKEHLNNNQQKLLEPEILITSLNVYLIFGFDNARKILLDFFTYATESSKTKQAELEFAEARKE